MQKSMRAVLVLTATCAATFLFAAEQSQRSGGVLADLPNFKDFKAARWRRDELSGRGCGAGGEQGVSFVFRFLSFRLSAKFAPSRS